MAVARVVHCDIAINKRSVDERVFSDTPISLPYLKTLRLSHPVKESLEHMFSALHLPQLEEVYLKSSDTAGKTLPFVMQKHASTLEHLEAGLFRVL